MGRISLFKRSETVPGWLPVPGDGDVRSDQGDVNLDDSRDTNLPSA